MNIPGNVVRRIDPWAITGNPGISKLRMFRGYSVDVRRCSHDPRALDRCSRLIDNRSRTFPDYPPFLRLSFSALHLPCITIILPSSDVALMLLFQWKLDRDRYANFYNTMYLHGVTDVPILSGSEYALEEEEAAATTGRR